MKAVEIRAFGGPEGLAVTDLAEPSPADGQVLIAVGGGVDPAWTGQRVWAFTGLGGGYVEQAIAPAGEILVLPAGLSAVDAVTLGSSGVVAHFALAQARWARGESVLVRGAGGSIGIMAVQLAARGGASAVAVSTSSRVRPCRRSSTG